MKKLALVLLIILVIIINGYVISVTTTTISTTTTTSSSSITTTTTTTTTTNTTTTIINCPAGTTYGACSCAAIGNSACTSSDNPNHAIRCDSYATSVCCYTYIQDCGSSGCSNGACIGGTTTTTSQTTTTTSNGSGEETTTTATSATTSTTGSITTTSTTTTKIFEYEKPANIILPAATASSPMRVDRKKGNYPGIYFTTNGLLIFYNDVRVDQPDYTALYVRSSGNNGASFAPEVKVFNFAYGVDFLEDVNIYKAIVTSGDVTGGDTRILESADGGNSWYQTHIISTSDAGCTPKDPSNFIRPQPNQSLIAQTFMHNSGVFGCSPQIKFLRYQNGSWNEPVSVGNGLPVGSYITDGIITIGGSNAVFYSNDDGKTFHEVPDGDTLKDKIRGNSLRRGADGIMYLIQVYNYANTETVALLSSSDDGITWNHKIILHNSTYIIKPVMAVSGNTIVVAWLDSVNRTILGSYYKYDAFFMYSPDGGNNWSEPSKINEIPNDHNLGGLAVATQPNQAAVVYAETGKEIEYEFKGVYFVLMTW